MSQADMEKAYTEAVDHLARAVEANRLLTERLQAYELREGTVRADCMSVTCSRHPEHDDGAGCPHGCGDYMAGFDHGMAKQGCDTLAILDRPVGPSHSEEPPARPGEP